MIVLPQAIKKKSILKKVEPRVRRCRRTELQMIPKIQLQKFHRIMRANVFFTETDRRLHVSLADLSQEDYEFMLDTMKMQTINEEF